MFLQNVCLRQSPSCMSSRQYGKEKANIETESIGYHALVDMGGPLQGRQNIQCNGHLNIKQKK